MITGNEFAMSRGIRYPKPNESTPTNGSLVLGLFLVGIAMTFLVSCAKAKGWM